MSSSPLRLYTFAISHFSEKIRWILDATGTPYEEVSWTPVFHVARALFKSRRATTVPILEVGDEVVQDSTRILLWLEKNRAPFALIPEDAAVRAEVLEVEERFDRIGGHVIRYTYAFALDRPEGVVDAWTMRSSGFTKKLLGAIFPAVDPLMRRQFRIEPSKVARSREAIEEAFDWLDARLEGGRRHLVGDRLTAADITAAALLAPLVCPDEHPVYGREDFRATIGSAAAPFEGRPGFKWVRELYRTNR
jgi:glutathione S-transferase